ncbi:DNA replication/repair protein RecF [Mycoplasmatota bacterium]|nr:DNA replication/repair protein RecF [Mycoplasmatota bacterium]
MKLNQLSLYNYRGYNKQDIAFGKGVNLFIGDNGSGKTNLLEAIYFLSLAKSYKTEDSNLIKFNQDFSRILTTVDLIDKSYDIKIILSKNKKKIILDGREIQKLSDYIGQVNVVSFLPEDMNLIKGPPKNRRYFIDSIIGQMDRNYLIELSNYKSFLKQRNDLIKKLSEDKNPDMTLLDIYTEQLAKAGEKIISYRNNFINKINLELKSIYPYLANNPYLFEFKYLPSIDSSLEGTLKENYRKDLFVRTTTSGPHRDDYGFLMDDIDAKDIASQGEQRIMILSSLLAVTEIIFHYKKQRPILLLDDVFSELDTTRQNKLIHFLNKSHLQTIITTTTTTNINQEILDDAKIFNVKNHFIRGNKHE